MTVAISGIAVWGACGASDAVSIRAERPVHCDPPLRMIHAGPSVARLGLTHREALCDSRPPHAFVVYGTCHAESDMGCAPPLEIQTYRACDRSPASYARAGRRPHPAREIIRGVPARFYESGGRLELSTGELTVVIFGRSRRLMRTAAEQLRPRGSLPAPAPGAEAGRLRCR